MYFCLKLTNLSSKKQKYYFLNPCEPKNVQNCKSRKVDYSVEFCVEKDEFLLSQKMYSSIITAEILFYTLFSFTIYYYTL